jgi:hypothetical protein
MSFAAFFDDSLAAKDLLRDLVAHEDRAHPLSDDDLARLLAAKDREALGVSPSRLRRGGLSGRLTFQQEHAEYLQKPTAPPACLPYLVYLPCGVGRKRQ